MDTMEGANMACFSVETFSCQDELVRYRYADTGTRSMQEVLLPRMRETSVGEALYHAYTCYGIISYLECDGKFMLFQRTLLHSSLLN